MITLLVSKNWLEERITEGNVAIGNVLIAYQAKNGRVDIFCNPKNYGDVIASIGNVNFFLPVRIETREYCGCKSIHMFKVDSYYITEIKEKLQEIGLNISYNSLIYIAKGEIGYGLTDKIK